jgi:hypothetical protein
MAQEEVSFYVHFVMVNLQEKNAANSLIDVLKDHRVLASPEGGTSKTAKTLWFHDGALMQENAPYARSCVNIYTKPQVWDKHVFGVFRSTFEAVSEDTDIFMTFDNGVAKGASDIRKAAAAMELTLQSMLLVPDEDSLVRRRDFKRQASLACTTFSS